MILYVWYDSKNDQVFPSPLHAWFEIEECYCIGVL